MHSLSHLSNNPAASGPLNQLERERKYRDKRENEIVEREGGREEEKRGSTGSEMPVVVEQTAAGGVGRGRRWGRQTSAHFGSLEGLLAAFPIVDSVNGGGTVLSKLSLKMSQSDAG